MQENNFFNGLFRPRDQKRAGGQPPERSKYQRLLITFCVIGVLLYPFSFIGVIPLLAVQIYDRKDRAANIYNIEYESFLKRGSSFFFLIAFGFVVLNLLCFTLWIPRGYFSSYLLFPLNQLHTALQFSWQTVVALLLGGCGMGSIFVAFSSFVMKRKVVSKEEERKKITDSKAYKQRKKDKFKESQKFTKEEEEQYEVALDRSDFDAYDRLKSRLLIGTSEFGLPYYISIAEINQHVLIPATTGSGKTTLLQLLIQHAAKFDMPLILIDGKGAKDTLTAMREIANEYDKEVHAFTDDGEMRYNPVQYGNDISVRDKLANIAETESAYYTMAAKTLLQVTVQLIDLFSYRKDVDRTLVDIQKFMLPRNVLKLFADNILEKNPSLYEIEVEKKVQKNSKKGKKTSNKRGNYDAIDPEVNDTFGDDSEKTNDGKEAIDFQTVELEEDKHAQPETETIIVSPDTLELESFYFLVKRNLFYLSDEEEIMFERIFTRYEHKDSPFYLYETSEALQMNLNMLLDSELGELFNTKSEHPKLDVQRIARRNELVYISLNGLIYKEFIRTLAQMIVGDVNYFASEMYRKEQKKGIFVIFDEPASYLNEAFIDMVNKGRGAGVYGVFSPQTMADIAKLGDKLLEQLVGNVNTLILGKTNEPGEVEYWSKAIGTYQDIEMTSVTEQEEGYSDVGKSDWAGDKGTKRNVDRFKVHPNTIKNLRTGEFIIYRTALNIDEDPQTVYVRNALQWLKQSSR